MNVHIEDTQKNVDNREIFKRYQDYKQTSLDWLDQIPDHWNEIKAKWACDKITDGSHHSPSEDKSGDRIYITVNDIEDDTINFDGAKRISDEDFRELEKGGCRPNSGDVLLSKDGTIGKSLVVESNNFVVLSSIAILRPSNRFHPKFVKYFCDSKFCLEQMKSRLKGSALTRITLELIKEFDYLYPPKEEQKAIVNFLDQETEKIDRLIEKKERLIELLEEKREALITRAVTKGLDPDAEMKDSGVEWLGEIPESWDPIKFKFLGTLTGGGTPDKGNEEYWEGTIPWISPKDMDEDFISETEDYITEKALLDNQSKFVEQNSIIFVVRSGILQHSFPVSINKVDASINQDLKALELRDQFSTEYVFWLLNGCEDHILNFAHKVGATVDNIEVDRLKNLPLPVPPKSEQLEIAEFLSEKVNKMNTFIQKIERSIDVLQEYRKSLISNTVTGKIDVREEVDAY